MKLKEQTMKLSDNALAILKNFAGINNSILVKQGNKLRTISVAKNILAEAEIKEDFPRDFAIYDLNQFLNGLSLHQDPDLDFACTVHRRRTLRSVGSARTPSTRGCSRATSRMRRYPTGTRTHSRRTGAAASS